MKYIFLLFTFFISLYSNATTVSISPQNPVVLLVNRQISSEFLYAPNTQIQISINNSTSTQDLIIANIFVSSPYSSGGLNHFYYTEDLKPFNINPNTGFAVYDNIDYKIPAGVDTILGKNNDTWFFVSNMLGLNGNSYFGNEYNAVMDNFIRIGVVGYYVDNKGFPTKNFKEEIKLNILTP